MPGVARDVMVAIRHGQSCCLLGTEPGLIHLCEHNTRFVVGARVGWWGGSSAWLIERISQAQFQYL